ncbi:MAG: ATP-binding cassette domain-containing protein [Halieaceae bacterium]|nr:ATP-binding cassette domain-containing protein [Halieaceae bacterium]
MSNSVLQCISLAKQYADGSNVVQVLNNLNFELSAGELVAILGVSGSGKSTLLNVLGGLDEPSAGDVLVNGVSWAQLSVSQRCAYRNEALGFVYQFHHLLADFNACENVAMPLRIAGASKVQAKSQALQWLDRLGLSARADHRPSQLSGGERQRVAIARALVREPAVVLMDEPTGNLDRESAERVLATLEELRDVNSAFVIVTHDESVAARADRRLRLDQGQLVTIE